jgi:hypothetical protein
LVNVANVSPLCSALVPFCVLFRGRAGAGEVAEPGRQLFAGSGRYGQRPAEPHSL